ncbi:MAG: hypothetical protein AB1641_11345 [Thermodesulfobacteriota bacterium]
MNLAFYLLIGSYGALALTAQVVFIRQLLIVFHGNELVVALVMAGWLAGVFLGAWLVGLAKPERRPGIWLQAGTCVWLAVLSGLLALSYLLPGLTGLSAGEVAPLEKTLIWGLLLTVPASFCVGGLFVVAGLALARARRASGRELGLIGPIVFWIESAGAFLGLMVYTFLLAGRAGPVEVLALFGLLTLGLLPLTLTRSAKTRAILLAVLLLAGGLGHGTGLVSRLDQAADGLRFSLAHPAYRLLAARETPYQHLALAGRGGEMALFGNHVFLHSWPSPEVHQPLALFFLTEAARGDRVMLAGQGPGGFIHEFLQRKVNRLVYVALDPAETDLVRGHLPPELSRDLNDPRLEIYHDDPRRCLSRPSDDIFDLIVINAPDPDTAQVNRLYTKEFFQAARRRLSPEGVLVTSISGAENLWSREMLSYGSSLYLTLKSVFPEVLVTPGDRHFFLAATGSGIISDDPVELAARYVRRGFDSPYMTPRSFNLYFPPTGRDYLKARLAEAAASPESSRLNTDVWPLSYFLRLIWWEKMTGRREVRLVLAGAMELRTWAPWAAAAACLPLLFLIVRSTPARVSGWTMASTGFATMALQIILIFLFQNKHGIIYQQIGLLSALFMAGLAGGGLIGRLAARRSRATVWVAPMLELALAGLAGASAAVAWERLPDLVLVLTPLNGLIGGLEFSFLFNLHLQDRTRPPLTRVISRLEAADHGGAMLGALVTGLILAPVMGLGLTALALAAYKILSALTIFRAATLFHRERPAPAG